MILLDALIAVMPVVGLYSQYALIKERKHIGSFSIDTCAILLLANILRIMFWFSKGFANNLLIQSFVVIAMTFALLDLCIQVGYKMNNSLTDLSGEEQQGFWRWNSIGPFIAFTSVFTLVMGMITMFFVHFDITIYGEVMGLSAIGIECLLGFPQLITNQKAKSVEGLSIFMILTWFVGDFVKTIYFIIELQPAQFIVGGALQLSVDLLIVIQIMAFKGNYQQVKEVKQIPPLTDQVSANQQESPNKMYRSTHMQYVEGI